VITGFSGHVQFPVMLTAQKTLIFCLDTFRFFDEQKNEKILLCYFV